MTSKISNQIASRLLEDAEYALKQEIIRGAPVTARLVSDDNQLTVEFDARPFLIEEPPEEIVKLAREDWCRSYVADRVAHRSRNPAVQKVLDQLRAAGFGFEVFVDDEAAMEWLETNRPHVFDLVLRASIGW